MAVEWEHIDWDNASLEWLLNSPDGPVGQMLEELGMKATEVAKVAAPIQKPQNWSWGRNSTSYQPRSFGYLKDSVNYHMGYTKMGHQLFSGVNAAYGPTLFLEKPARQQHRSYPFLTEALWSVNI